MDEVGKADVKTIYKMHTYFLGNKEVWFNLVGISLVKIYETVPIPVISKFVNN